jgi:RimJ/RimL family protein N-acetyltransferase
MNCCISSGKLITLRPLESKDINVYLEQLSDVVKQTLHIGSNDDESTYISERLVAQKNNITCVYAVINNKSNELIGAVEIRPPIQYSGQLYIWLNEHYWGGGYFKEAIQIVIALYFQETNASFFTAHVDVYNTRSYFALKKAGFTDSAICNGPYGQQYVLLYRRRCR